MRYFRLDIVLFISIYYGPWLMDKQPTPAKLEKREEKFQKESFEPNHTEGDLKEKVSTQDPTKNSSQLVNENKLGTGRILLVDDDIGSRQVLQEGIQRGGFDCTTVENANEALRVLEKSDMDVVVTDIKMPDINGLELTKVIKKKYDSDVIVITGYTDDYKYEEAIAAGASDFIGKPINLKELFLRLKRILRERDILYKRKQTEEALIESEKKYRSLIENSLTGIFILQEGRYVFFNNQFAEIHGYKCEEILNIESFGLIHPEEREKVAIIASKRLKGEPAPRRYEVRRLRKDGKVIWCKVMAAEIRYKGKPAIMGNVIDISERKIAEEALQESEKKFKTILASIEDGYFEVDLAGNFTFVNDSLCRSFGYSREEMMGMNNREYMEPETAKSIYKIFNEVYKTGNPVKITDYEIILKDGSKLLSTRRHNYDDVLNLHL